MPEQAGNGAERPATGTRKIAPFVVLERNHLRPVQVVDQDAVDRQARLLRLGDGKQHTVQRVFVLDGEGRGKGLRLGNEAKDVLAGAITGKHLFLFLEAQTEAELAVDQGLKPSRTGGSCGAAKPITTCDDSERPETVPFGRSNGASKGWNNPKQPETEINS